MATRRSANSQSASSPNSRYGSLSRRQYPLRHSSRTQKHVLLKQDSASHDLHQLNHVASRPVLVPLHPNLRRLPSRLNMAISRERVVDDDRDDGAKVGGKRKRIASVNENTYLYSRNTRTAAGRFKRMRSMADSADTSDDGMITHASGMDVDEEQDYKWPGSDGSDGENGTHSNCMYTAFLPILLMFNTVHPYSRRLLAQRCQFTTVISLAEGRASSVI